MTTKVNGGLIGAGRIGQIYVVIYSTSANHAQFITPAGQAGKPIFCEKLISDDLVNIDQALAAVAQTGGGI